MGTSNRMSSALEGCLSYTSARTHIYGIFYEGPLSIHLLLRLADVEPNPEITWGSAVGMSEPCEMRVIVVLPHSLRRGGTGRSCFVPSNSVFGRCLIVCACQSPSEGEPFTRLTHEGMNVSAPLWGVSQVFKWNYHNDLCCGVPPAVGKGGRK